jgi:hypothetical protein
VFRAFGRGAGAVSAASAGMAMSQAKTAAEDALFDRSPIHFCLASNNHENKQWRPSIQ